jgi:rod shape-determining protein MreC
VIRDQKPLALRLVLVWLLLEAIAAAQVRSPTGANTLVTWLRAAGDPVVIAARWTCETCTSIASGLCDFQSLIASRHQLRLELEEERARRFLLEEDLITLREALRLGAPVVELADSSVPARCIYRSLSEGRMGVVLDRHIGLGRESPVLSEFGLVGRVVSQDRRFCWVELISHPAAAVAVRNHEGTVQGLVVGTGGATLRVEYVPRAAPLLRGALLVTSGADGIYPGGVPVAEVTAIRESNAPFLEVSARPTARLSTLRVVLLIPRSKLGGQG